MASPPPRSTVERLSAALLPPVAHRFLFSQSEEFSVAQLLLRGLFGAISGSVLFLGIAHSLPLTFDLKLAAGCIFVVVCCLGGALSSWFRCSVMLMFPSILGSRGRGYLMVLALSVLYAGPLTNIQRNMQTAAESLSCNLDLQIHNSRLLWRDAVSPFLRITQELMNDSGTLRSEALNISAEFQAFRRQLLDQYGYQSLQPAEPDRDLQDQFRVKTMMQCDGVVDEGVQRCTDWFKVRWDECMKAIPVPIINHILCVSMTFDFLCQVMRVMTPWCRQQIPVEGNFAQFFKQLNVSVDQLSQEFQAKLVMEEQQRQRPVLDGAPLDQEFTQEVKGSFQKLRSGMTQLLDLLHLLLSFTFISIFTQAFGYLHQFCTDIHFDNVYVTTYFRQIDACRRTEGKRCVLPLRGSERRCFIDPRSFKIHSEELKQVVSGVIQVLSISLLSVILLTVDSSVYHVLDIVSRHTVTQFNITSRHKVEMAVGGDSMMARLLRNTVSAFNSSSHIRLISDNRLCVATPSSLPVTVYLSCVACVLLAALFCCFQVYTNRLRRVIAAFYHPKREKKRILFLYNLQIQRRISTENQGVTPRRRCRKVLERVSRWMRGLCCRHRKEASNSERTYYFPS